MYHFIPQPAMLTPLPGTFTLTPAAVIRTLPEQEKLTFIARYLAERLPFGLDIKTMPPQTGDICLQISGADAMLGDEGYRLEVRADRVTVTAAAEAGLFYGVQTLRQMFSPVHSVPESGSRQIDCILIQDAPRFPWRGMMLDVSRHFFGVDVVKRMVDLLAFYKFNRLHLHLTDDQGWRIEIKRWPRLTEHGGRTSVNGDGGGYYTQEQYREIVAYAAERYITVVPEIDMPGHTNAALASVPELNAGGSVPSLYEGVEVGFSSLVIQDAFTQRFLEDVIGEVAALTPGAYIHIGGDETHSTPEEDYKVFLERVQTIVQSCGKQLMGWEEIGKARLSPQNIVQFWSNAEHALAAARQGCKMILSPAKRIYLDIKYNQNTPLGLTWPGSPVSVRTSYEWDPAAYIKGLPADAILGVEAPLWSETTRTLDDLDYMVFPRLCGAAEIGWSPQKVRRWEDYRLRLSHHGKWLDAFGVKFYRSRQVNWA
jgi:hexosaminidase